MKTVMNSNLRTSFLCRRTTGWSWRTAFGGPTSTGSRRWSGLGFLCSWRIVDHLGLPLGPLGEVLLDHVGGQDDEQWLEVGVEPGTDTFQQISHLIRRKIGRKLAHGLYEVECEYCNWHHDGDICKFEWKRSAWNVKKQV